MTHLIINLALISVGASFAVGSLVGLLARFANRERSSEPPRNAGVEIMERHTEEERVAALAELAPFDPADPAQAERREREWWDAEWHTFWASHEETAEHGRQWLARLLDEFESDWRESICDRAKCDRCVHSAAEAMRRIGVIALGSSPVDSATGEYKMIGAQ